MHVVLSLVQFDHSRSHKSRSRLYHPELFASEKEVSWARQMDGSKADTIDRFHMLPHPEQNMDREEDALNGSRFDAIFKKYPQQGADSNEPSHLGLKPLFYCIRMGRKDLVKMLLEYGADPTDIGLGINAHYPPQSVELTSRPGRALSTTPLINANSTYNVERDEGTIDPRENNIIS